MNRVPDNKNGLPRVVVGKESRRSRINRWDKVSKLGIISLTALGVLATTNSISYLSARSSGLDCESAYSILSEEVSLKDVFMYGKRLNAKNIASTDACEAGISFEHMPSEKMLPIGYDTFH